MNRGALSASIVLALAGATATADDKKLVPAQQPPTVSVQCSVVEIWASSGKGGIDPAIDKKIVNRLQNFKWTEYKQLSNTTATLTKKKAESAKLQKGSATLTLIEIVDKSRVRMQLQFTSNKVKIDHTITIAGGDWNAEVAKESGDPKSDGHILAVGDCK